VVDTLEIFKGQLSITDIYNLTYKELGYLRKFRIPIVNEMKKSVGALGALFG
jgi:hypothetical protein